MPTREKCISSGGSFWASASSAYTSSLRRSARASAFCRSSGARSRLRLTSHSLSAKSPKMPAREKRKIPMVNAIHCCLTDRQTLEADELDLFAELLHCRIQKAAHCCGRIFNKGLFEEHLLAQVAVNFPLQGTGARRRRNVADLLREHLTNSLHVLVRHVVTGAELRVHGGYVHGDIVRELPEFLVLRDKIRLARKDHGAHDRASRV